MAMAERWRSICLHEVYAPAMQRTMALTEVLLIHVVKVLTPFDARIAMAIRTGALRQPAQPCTTCLMPLFYGE